MPTTARRPARPKGRIVDAPLDLVVVLATVPVVVPVVAFVVVVVPVVVVVEAPPMGRMVDDVVVSGTGPAADVVEPAAEVAGALPEVEAAEDALAVRQVMSPVPIWTGAESATVPVESLIWKVTCWGSSAVFQVRELAEVVPSEANGAALCWPAGWTVRMYGGVPPVNVKSVGWQTKTLDGVLMVS